MKLSFVLANENDCDFIYALWSDVTGKRLFGLKKSIDNGDVWVMKKNGLNIGFCRYNSDEGVRLDYIKFFEIALLTDQDKKIQSEFFNFIDRLILGNGYFSGKVFTSNHILYLLFIKNGWVETEIRFSPSRDNKMVYTNFILERNLNFNIVGLKKYFGIVHKGEGKIV